MKKNWFYIISPCVIAAIILGTGLIKDTIQGGWSMLGVVAGLPFLAIIIVVGIATRLLIKKSALVLWIVEILLVALAWLIVTKFGK